MFSFIANQFSNHSEYDISVNVDCSESFNIDFGLSKVENFLSEKPCMNFFELFRSRGE